MPDEAYSILQDCLADAKSAGEKDIMLMSLATCGLDASPSVRHMLAADINQYGVLFFTNKTSGKGQQIAANPRIGLSFYWQSIGHQMVMEGHAVAASDSETESIWLKRDRDKQIAAWASNQSENTRGKHSHQERLTKTRQSFGYDQVPLPENWAAYRVSPTRIEFWRAGWRSIKDRVAFELRDNGWQSAHYEP